MSFTLKYNNGTIFDPINFRNASNLTAENIVTYMEEKAGRTGTRMAFRNIFLRSMILVCFKIPISGFWQMTRWTCRLVIVLSTQI